MSAALEIGRLVVVVALLCAAGALATPKGRLPLALRGVLKTLRRDGAAVSADAPPGADRVPLAKRLLSLVLILFALLLVLV